MVLCAIRLAGRSITIDRSILCAHFAAAMGSGGLFVSFVSDEKPFRNRKLKHLRVSSTIHICSFCESTENW
jgi:hypothetical protein